MSDDQFEFTGEVIEVPDDSLMKETFPANAKLECWEDLDKLYYPWLLNGVINRLNEGFAPIIVICGQERIGKSTMAVDLAWRLANEANALDIKLDGDNIQDFLAYQPQTFLEIITESEGRKPVLIDEAGVVAGSQDHQTKENRIIKKVIQTMGYKNNVYIFILPDFKALDKKIRNKVDFKVELYERGKAKVTGIRTNFGKMRSKEFDFYKQPLPAYWMGDYKDPEGFKEPEKQKVMDGYDKKEKDFKQGNAEDMLDEIKDIAKDEEEDEIDIDKYL
jgi:hypothetical protein